MIPPAESGPDGKIPPAPGTNQITGFVEFRPLTHWEKNNGGYPSLVYTKTVDSVEGALWLASQTPNILCYLPPSNSG